MIQIYNNKFYNSSFIYVFIIAIYSFCINFYYSNLGVYPIDTFLHYDSSYRILKNELPVKDYWIVSGFIVEYIQSIFFKILGTNWFAYILHSSSINLMISILVYYFFLDLKLNNYQSLLYTLSFSTLAYTVSGTPFVDHHAVFFLMVSTFCIIRSISSPNNKKIYLFLIVMFSFLSFLSKQVPISYAILSQGILAFIIFKKEKSFYFFKYLFSYLIIILLFFIVFLNVSKIDLSLFLEEYIFYPKTIGSERILLFGKSFEIFFNQYKFLIIPLLISVFLRLKILSKESADKKNNIFIYLIFIFFSLSVIFHQLLTKNQIFIYFLIPLIFGFLDKDLEFFFTKKKKIISIFLILILTFITIKYHLRYNEGRKFHELSRINLENAIDAKNIHKSLSGLKWINPFFDGTPAEEVEIIKKGIEEIENQDSEIMLITHYLFIDSITKKNMNLPTKTFTTDGASYPLLESEYFNIFNYFIKNHLIEKKINKVYFFNHENLSKKIIIDNIDSSCINKKKNKLFTIFEMLCFN